MSELGPALPPASQRAVLTGSALAVTGAIAYGINIVGARLCASLGISGSDIVAYRAALLAPLLALIVLAFGRRLALMPDERPQVLRFAVFAAGTALFYLSALRYLPVAVAVTIFYSYPLILIVLTPYLDRVRLPMRRWLVALIACAGVLIAVGPDVHGLDPRGILFALSGAGFCAAMFIAGSRLTTDSTVTFFWCQLVALPLALGFAYVTGGLAEPSLLLVGLLPLAVNIGGYFLGFLFQIMAAPRISAATAGLLFLFEPVAAILGAAAVLGERISMVQGIGMAMVIGALVWDMLPALRATPDAIAADLTR